MLEKERSYLEPDEVHINRAEAWCAEFKDENENHQYFVEVIQSMLAYLFVYKDKLV